ncbi:MAG: 30S ribosomal protein S5 [Candidatus Kaelpia imicola]|nr:30S ribosomal protein S5 [Candidatus Kaelpia imicola]
MVPENQEITLLEKVIAINRVTKTNKGGKTISFNALVAVGNGRGRVGISLGKAHEVVEAIKKGIKSAQRDVVTIKLLGSTIPHDVLGKFGASKIVLKPASAGTGVIAGGVVRAICEMVGIKDILTKSLGSPTAINLAKAMMDGLKQLRVSKSGVDIAKEEVEKAQEVKDAVE